MGLTEASAFKDNTIVDSDIKSNAAIAGTKINPNFSGQHIINTGTLSTGNATATRLTISGTGVPLIDFIDSDNNPDFSIRADVGSFRIKDTTSNVERFIINSDGHIDVLGNLDVGAGLDVTGNITVTGTFSAPAQPCCLLTHPVDEAFTSADDNIPLEFTTTETNVGCTVNSAKSRITIPVAGTYLITACISGTKTDSGNSGDNIIFKLLKNGSTATTDTTQTFPNGSFGVNQGDEFAFNFTLPLTLAANDYLEVAIFGVGNSRATGKQGYFSVTKLH